MAHRSIRHIALAHLSALALFAAAVTGEARASVLVDFDGVDASAGTVGGAALSAYLGGFGITLSNATDPSVGISADANIYGGLAITPSSGQNALAMAGSAAVTQSYRLTFSAALDQLQFDRVQLDTAPSGIAFPQWTVQAFDVSDVLLGSVGEAAQSYFGPSAPAATFTLNGGASGISYIVVSGNANNFAAFSNVVIDDLVLTAADQVPEPAGIALLGIGLAALRRLRRGRRG
jgi:hypothetical protein